MVLPRIGAILLLIGYGFAAASVARLMYRVASEGYSSWVPVAIFLAPAAILGMASAVLVLFRKPLGRTLVKPFLVVLIATGIITFAGLPPVGTFLDDYEEAAIEHGVDVPDYYEAKGLDERDFVESETGDVRSQGGIGAIGLGVIYAVLVLRGSRAPARKAGAQSSANAEA
jgi:hypothetical protein